jgi:HKD family nuclease
MDFLSQPQGNRLGDLLLQELRDARWTTFRGAIAFVKRSGVRHLAAELSAFAARAEVKLAVGVDRGGTSLEGLAALYEAVRNLGQIWVFHNENGNTFHPKLYLFRNADAALLVVGSGNLTEGGLFTNYEAGLAVSLNLDRDHDRQLLTEVETILDGYSEASPTSILVTDQLFEALANAGYISRELYSRPAQDGEQEAGDEAEYTIFQGVAVRPAPRPVRPAAPPPGPVAGAGPGPNHYRFFYMTLQRTDVGVGQVTAGAARRSPEVFIPLAARDFAPDFWRYPVAFTADPEKPGKMDRFGVPMLVGTQVVEVNMMTWPDKHDFRLRSETLRSAGNVGDVLRIERTDGQRGYEYVVHVIPQDSALYELVRERCRVPVRNSRKVWGYD